jgi:hypothetical protein
VTWPDGQVEDVASFKTEADANEWIANRVGWRSATLKPIRGRSQTASRGPSGPL